MGKENRKFYGLIAIVFFSICVSGFFLLKNPFQKEEWEPLIKENGYFYPLKINGYSRANQPYLDIIIEGKKIPSIIDLGYGGTLSLYIDVIKEINDKKLIERTRTYGIRGKSYENDVYEVKNIDIENVSFSPVRVKERCVEIVRDAHLMGESDPSDHPFGVIGWHLFYTFNLLVDCKHSVIALCDSLETLKQHGYSVDSFTETPLILNSKFIEFEALTEKGLLSCVLDTGATWNMLNKDLENEYNEHRIVPEDENIEYLLNPENKDLLIYDPEDTQEFSSFKIEGKEFGPQRFSRIKSPLSIDAIIGMEFFDANLVFIDFANKKVYFYPYPKEEKGKLEENLEHPI